MQTREKEEEGEMEAQRVEQTVLGLLNEGEGAANRSDAQQCSVVCSLYEMSLLKREIVRM